MFLIVSCARELRLRTRIVELRILKEGQGSSRSGSALPLTTFLGTRGRECTSAELPVPIDGSGDRRGRPQLATEKQGGSGACVARGDQWRSASTRPAGELI